MDLRFLDERPIIIAIAGPNGAGKTTFYESFLWEAGLPFVNADNLAAELRIGAYEAADIAGALRQTLVDQRESFVFETVLSDPVGEKVQFLKQTIDVGYTVVLFFIWIPDADTSIERVSMRVVQGGHDIPDQKLRERILRTRRNLERAVVSLPHVIVYDNSDLAHPYRQQAVFRDGNCVSGKLPDPP